MSGPSLQFRPDWKTSLFAGCLLPLLIGLGFWQLDRAEQKKAMAGEYLQRLHGDALEVTPATQQVSRYQRLRARGRYDNAHSFLLDNRLRDGRFGYEIVTPLLLANSAGLPGPTVLLVNRGWVQGDPGRRWQPEIELVRGEVTLEGYAYHPQPLPTAAFAGEASWPMLAQWVNLDAFADQLEAPVKPFVLRLDPSAAGALRADWPLLNLQPEQHIGYAVQWFGMAITLVLIWLLLSTNVRAWWSARHGDSND